MNSFTDMKHVYEFKKNSAHFSYLATNSDISKLAYKIMANKAYKVNTLCLKRAKAATVAN